MNNRFYYNVKTLCKKQGIKISELEKAIGVSSGYLSRKSNYSLNNAYKIAKYLRYDLTDMIEHNYGIEFQKREIEEKIKELKKQEEKLQAEMEALYD